jgi:hypothetical protein
LAVGAEGAVIFSTLFMAKPSRTELPNIEATLDLILWFIPLLNHLTRTHQFALSTEAHGFGTSDNSYD